MSSMEEHESTTRVSKPEPLVFEVAIEQAQNQDASYSALKARSVVVEIEAQDMLDALTLAPDPADAARREAAELACRIAVQAVEKDLPAGVAPACRPSPMDRLPDGLQVKAPSLHTADASAWLV